MAVGQLTGETIISSIALAIRSFFATGTAPDIKYPKIYKERTVEGFYRPCFFIWSLPVETEKLLRDLYKKKFQMVVRYHPETGTDTTYEKLRQAGEDLVECLESINVPITINGTDEILLPVRGKDIEYKIEDGILQFFVTYIVQAKKAKVTQTDNMEEVSVVVNLKEDL